MTSLAPAGKDFTVTLPTVSKQALTLLGMLLARTPFQSTANCSQGKVATYFEQVQLLTSILVVYLTKTLLVLNVNVQLLVQQ